jgi:hypothetical protein
MPTVSLDGPSSLASCSFTTQRAGKAAQSILGASGGEYLFFWKQKSTFCIKSMHTKFKYHLNKDDVIGSMKSEKRKLLEDVLDEEEALFLKGPFVPRFGLRNCKIKHVKDQVDEVIDVMQEYITKVIEKGKRIDELQDKSENL